MEENVRGRRYFGPTTHLHVFCSVLTTCKNTITEKHRYVKAFRWHRFITPSVIFRRKIG